MAGEAPGGLCMNESSVWRSGSYVSGRRMKSMWQPISALFQFCSRQKKPIMPPKTEEPLNSKEVSLIKAWLDEGAKAPDKMKVKEKIIVNLPPARVRLAADLAPRQSVLLQIAPEPGVLRPRPRQHRQESALTTRYMAQVVACAELAVGHVQEVGMADQLA